MNESEGPSTPIAAEAYWDARYREVAGHPTSGKPGAAVRQFVTPLVPGRALELGCGRGDDTVWLASTGWSVTAVDVSSVALRFAAAQVAQAGLTDRVTFEQHDLALSFPTGCFDLVTATHLAAFPREPVFKRAAAAVAAGGRLLIVDPTRPGPIPEPIRVAGGQYPTLEETLANLELHDQDWKLLRVGVVERARMHSNAKNGANADNVIFLERL